MYSPNNSIAAEIIEAYSSSVRNVNCVVSVTKSGTTQTFTPEDALISFTVERVGDNSKFFGFGVFQKINIHLRDKDSEINIETGAKIKITSLDCNSYSTAQSFPHFFVTQRHRDENTGELSITAYDALYYASQKTYAELGEFADNETLADVVSAIMSAIPASANSYGNFSIFDYDDIYYFPKLIYFEDTATLKEVLDTIAEVTQSVYYMSRLNYLVFKRMTLDDANAKLVIEKNDYFELDSDDNRRLSTVAHVTELGDNVSATTGVSGTTAYIRDNILWATRDDIGDLVDAALANVGGMCVNQFEIDWRGCFMLDIGDRIGIETKDGKIAYSYLLDDVVSYDGTYSQKTRWKYEGSDLESETNSTSLGDALKQTFARVDKMNKEIQLVVSDNQETVDKVAALELTTDSINARVETLEENGPADLSERISALEIKDDEITTMVSNNEIRMDEINEEMTVLTNTVEQAVTSENVKIIVTEQLAEQGIDSITTSTGFTFDSEGITIDKSGTELKTQITENGMTVYRTDSPVLTATNAGVQAANLHATTYLIIGGLNRFEEYRAAAGATRIGAFWLLD